MGFGKGSGSSAPVVTEEQKELLRAQTGFLTDTALPQYKKTISGAEEVLGATAANAVPSMMTALGVAERGMNLGQSVGEGGMYAGSQGQGGLAQYQTQVGQNLLNTGGANLQNLFSPQYKDQQIQAALQPAREEIREQMGQQAALFGGAGGLGSSRQALASRNLASLGEQRMGSVAAQTSAGVEGQRQRAAESLMGAGAGALQQAGGLYGNLGSQGQSAISLANQLATSRLGISQAPLDVFGKYASVIYGTPQASTTPSFQGTQGQRTSSKGFGF
jgi:hypothetical protein